MFSAQVSGVTDPFSEQAMAYSDTKWEREGIIWGGTFPEVVNWVITVSRTAAKGGVIVRIGVSVDILRVECVEVVPNVLWRDVCVKAVVRGTASMANVIAAMGEILMVF
mmetsp:Transcript_24865/g.25303  ORF Transcript_24865/g.25303 Transcript_24865/m.25303 type:complete len:109 (-) Transcript_24865:9-335(-)